LATAILLLLYAYLYVSKAKGNETAEKCRERGRWCGCRPPAWTRIKGKGGSPSRLEKSPGCRDALECWENTVFTRGGGGWLVTTEQTRRSPKDGVKAGQGTLL